MEELSKLFNIIATLRGENGCSWDKAQTIETLTDALLEEVYEVVEAIEEKDLESLKEELGDLIFLSFFLSYIGEQEKRFTLTEVLSGVNEKLIRRHPHVFSNSEEKDISNILRNWENIKSLEKKNKRKKSIDDEVPKRLPEIQRFFKILDKLSRKGEEIPKIDKISVSKSLEDALLSLNEEKFVNFLKIFIIFAYQNKINLPFIIRKSQKILLRN